MGRASAVAHKLVGGTSTCPFFISYHPRTLRFKDWVKNLCLYFPCSGSGILLFIFHANFLGKDVIARLCGPCSVQAVILNDKFQLPVFLDSHFVYSFSPVAGFNKLFIRLTEAPSAKVRSLPSYSVFLLKLFL